MFQPGAVIHQRVVPAARVSAVQHQLGEGQQFSVGHCRAAGEELADQYRGAVKSLQDAGIRVFGTFAFGFDTDDEGIFERTVDFCIEAKVAIPIFSLLTPYRALTAYPPARPPR